MASIFGLAAILLSASCLAAGNCLSIVWYFSINLFTSAVFLFASSGVLAVFLDSSIASRIHVSVFVIPNCTRSLLSVPVPKAGISAPPIPARSIIERSIIEMSIFMSGMSDPRCSCVVEFGGGFDVIVRQ